MWVVVPAGEDCENEQGSGTRKQHQYFIAEIRFVVRRAIENPKADSLQGSWQDAVLGRRAIAASLSKALRKLTPPEASR